MLVYGTGADADSTGRLDLDRTLWTPEMDPGPAISGYLYSDPSGPIESATLRQGELSVTGSTANWPWTPAGSVDELWFWFVVEEEWFCAEASVQTATVTANQAENVRFVDTTAPFSCPPQKSGRRFSRKAVTPSVKSGRAKASRKRASAAGSARAASSVASSIARQPP